MLYSHLVIRIPPPQKKILPVGEDSLAFLAWQSRDQALESERR